MEKSVLMICYYYPPLADVGSKRSIAFSKYFKKNGWMPFVISVKNPDKAFCSIGADKPPEGIIAEYTYSLFNPYKYLAFMNGVLSKLLMLVGINTERNYLVDFFCIPDIFLAWVPFTAFKGTMILKKYNIDCIYVSCPPFSSAIIGIILKLLTGRPLLLDFRDPYALKRNPSINLKKKTILHKIVALRKALDQSIAKYLFKKTDIFVVTSEEAQSAYIEQYPIVQNKIHTVYNGFEPDYLPKKRTHKFRKFTVVYAGEFYSYSPQTRIYTKIFFEALLLLKKEGEINKNNFQFLFYGEGKSAIEEIANEYSIIDLVNANLRVSYEEIIEVILKSHLQLLRIIKLMISTKLFEGIALNLPFLATIPAGEVEAIIKKYSPSSYIITDESAENVAEAILDAMAKYNDNAIINNRVEEFLEDFSRENLTKQLMTLIESNMLK